MSKLESLFSDPDLQMFAFRSSKGTVWVPKSDIFSLRDMIKTALNSSYGEKYPMKVFHNTNAKELALASVNETSGYVCLANHNQASVEVKFATILDLVELFQERLPVEASEVLQ